VIEPEGTYVMTREFPPLAPNKVIDAIGALDRRLNKAVDQSLRSRLRELRQTADGGFEFTARDPSGPFSGRTLLFVHGTFSNAENMLNEFKLGPRAPRFLNRATRGAAKDDRVVVFGHPTPSVSPVMNALELGRAMSGSKGQLDVIAHSRGGLVVRWWLEAFGSSLRATTTPVRAVLAGSPLHGTSLAAPDKIQGAMSLVSNIGSFAEKTLSLVGVANPFLWVAGKLVEVIVSVTGALARTPNNAWALYGLAQAYSQEGLKREAKAVEARFNRAWMGNAKKKIVLAAL
jgi:pimeloyl-ACP methyl ester carboxylesterase